MSTNDPFSTTPQQPGSSQQSGAWEPAQMPPPPEPDVRTYDYGSTGYAAPQTTPQAPPPGFSSGAPTPQYGAPAPQYATSTAASMDGVSIAALVTGILGLALIPLVLGAVGLRRTAGGLRKGTWMAVTGLVLGILSTIAWTAAASWGIAAATIVIDSETFESDTMFSEGETYGDDPALDALWDECAAGSDAACDDLYWDSPIGSEYEEFGKTCGGRSDAFLGGSCRE